MEKALPHSYINGTDVSVITSASQYKQQLLAYIAQARQRIYITALYLQEDDAGTEVLNALYQAKVNTPALDIKVFVDFHRAQRGLIGEKQQLGNRAFYNKIAQQYPCDIEIYGVAVKSKELLGVLHLKGIVFDDALLYSGASINDIYLQQHGRYRLDRYYLINSRDIASSFCQYLSELFLGSALAVRLNNDSKVELPTEKLNYKRIKTRLKSSAYQVTKTAEQGEISITPLVGCGKRRNVLNDVICQLIKGSENSITLFTPYFNLPKVVTKQIISALKRGVKITIIVGDKKANDFYIADPSKFSTIGIVPYIYETILFRFVKRWQKYITSGQLSIKLWCDGDNSYHLKGLVVDDTYHLLTGSNLNPRAWGLDLENGLLLIDRQQKLIPLLVKELVEINSHTTVIQHFTDIEQIKDYPAKPKKIMRRLRISKIDRILKRFL